MTRFIHLTDLHISHPDAADPQYRADVAETLTRVVKAINNMAPQPDFVVASGDLTNKGDVLSYGALRDLLAPLRPPLLTALGNHDRREAFHEVFGRGPSDAAHVHDSLQAGLHVITLDTLKPGHVAGTITQAQFDFLVQALARHAEVPKLIVMHHPPRTNPAALPWVAIDAQATDRLAETLRGHPVAGILSGHIHMDRVIHWHGIPVVVSNGLHSGIDMMAGRGLRIVASSGFSICDWQPSGLAVTFVPVNPQPPELGVIDEARLRSFS